MQPARTPLAPCVSSASWNELPTQTVGATAMVAGLASSNQTTLKRPLSSAVVATNCAKRRMRQVDRTGAVGLHVSARSYLGEPMLSCSATPLLNPYDRFQDASRLKRNYNAESLIKHDNKLPMAYNNSVKKGMSKTIQEIQQSKCAKFFGVELDVPISEIPELVTPVETVVYVDWKRSGNVFNFDAKQLSTSAWRHFRMSWHDYMNMVILASPLRRDRLILEKVKNLGPPRSINALRQTFALGDSRSRRIFFQIYYVPRVAEKNDINLPSSLRMIEKHKDKRQVVLGMTAAQPLYHMAVTPFSFATNYIPSLNPLSLNPLLFNAPVVDLTNVQDMVIIKANIDSVQAEPNMDQGMRLQASPNFERGNIIDSKKECDQGDAIPNLL